MDKHGTTATIVRRYKLYKSGKQWVVGAIISFAAGVALLGHAPAQSVAADTNTGAQVATVAQRSSDATPTATATKTTQPAATTTPAQAATRASAQQTTATTASADQTSTKAQASTQPVTATGTTQKPDVENSTTQQADPSTSNDNDSDTLKPTWSPTTSTDSDSATATPKTTTNTTDPQNQASIKRVDVESLWKQGYTGAGSVVAVIDTGVAPHEDLRLSDDSTAKITKAAAEAYIAKVGYGSYVSAKIPFAYDYANNDSQDTAPTKLDAGAIAHGEHVAGIIAANGTDTNSLGGTQTYVKGMAPEAQILDMQVFGQFADENGNDVARAIYDAVGLGANVIQLSLGVGVAVQDPTDVEQAAIDYATDHGVFVSVSANNAGNAAAIYTATNAGGDTSANYDTPNDSTIADPGIAASATTVAAETTDADTMASFSSWGPNVDYTLKPDVSAPGTDIQSTWVNTDTGKTSLYAMSGTSMAGPHIAGIAALLMQKYTQTRPDLTGAAKVKAVKLALMNAAAPMADTTNDQVLLSPRQQGAGAVDATKAADLTVSAEGTNDAGSVSLHTIGKTANFTVTLTNFGDQAQTYTVDDYAGPQTQVEASDHTLHDAILSGAKLTCATPNFTLAAGETKAVAFTLTLADSVADQQLVEGYLHFNATDATQTLNVPYLGYYGDLTASTVIDASANTKQSAFGGGYLVDENLLPLGVADQASLNTAVANGQSTWVDFGTAVQNGKVAISPNADGISDAVQPYVFANQNLQHVTVEILNAAGKIVRVVDQENDLTKSYKAINSTYNNDLAWSVSMRQDPQAFTWDGKVYDQATGQLVTAPDGQYTYRIVTTNYNTGAKQTQDSDYPVKVDTVAPKFDQVTYQNGTLTMTYSDQGAGFTAASHAVLAIGGHEWGLSLTDANHGTLKTTLTAEQQAALTAVNGTLRLTLTDVAGNSTSKTFQVLGATQTNATPTGNDSTAAAPQFSWGVPNDPANGVKVDDMGAGLMLGMLASELPQLAPYAAIESNTGITVLNTSTADLTLHGRVPAGLNATAVAKDVLTGKTYQGTVDSTTGDVTFSIDLSANKFGVLVATVTTQAHYGDIMQSDETLPGSILMVTVSAKSAPYTTDELVYAPTMSDADALAHAKSVAATLPDRVAANVTTSTAANSGIHFNDVTDNGFTLINANAHFYDAATHMLTLNGKLTDPSAKLVFDAPDGRHEATVNSDGSFSVALSFAPTEQRGVGYELTTDAGTVDGLLELYVDTQLPTLTTKPVTLTTSADSITLAGQVNDNVSGYRLYVDGDNLVHARNLADFSNPYGASNFSQTYPLAMGVNVFTLIAKDAVGNLVTRVIRVTRTAASSTTQVTGSVNKHQSSPITLSTNAHLNNGHHVSAHSLEPDQQPMFNKLSTHAANNGRHLGQTAQAKLPHAGEQTSGLAFVGMWLLGLVDFVGVGRRKHI